MTFAVKSRDALDGVLCLALVLFGCAEGSAVKERFEDTIDNGSSADGGESGGDSAANGSDASATSGGGGASNGAANGASSSGATASTGDNASNGVAGDSGIQPSPDAGSDKDAGSACLPGTTQCGALCVDVKSSASNCGRCGHACSGGQACNGAGVCLAPAGCTLLSFENHDYITCDATKEWSDARNACLGWGMDLAVIGSAAENAFLKGHPGWFGYSDLTTEDSWLAVKPGGAVNGPVSPYANWGSDEPNNDRHCNLFGCDSNSGEDCAETVDDGSWNDAMCDTARRFLCETY